MLNIPPANRYVGAGFNSDQVSLLAQGPDKSPKTQNCEYSDPLRPVCYSFLSKEVRISRSARLIIGPIIFEVVPENWTVS